MKNKDIKYMTYSIKDNGKGLPEGFDYRTAKSLGLQLVSILTEQINGTLSVKSSPNGTEFVLLFPASNE